MIYLVFNLLINSKILWSCVFFIREKIEEFNRELERLQKSLSAKEELERNQIEAVI